MENLTEIVYDFSRKIIERVNGLIKFIVIFGSTTKNSDNEKSDIDILIVIDDVLPEYKMTDIAFYTENLNKVLSSDERFKKIHPVTLTLTSFYDGIIKGDPLILTVLRTGQPIIDPAGFFSAMKELLKAGKIKYTEESLRELRYRNKIAEEMYIQNVFKALESIYFASLSLAQYKLIKNKIYDVEPEKIADNLKKLYEDKFVSDFFSRLYEYTKKCSKNLNELKIENVKRFYDEYFKFKEILLRDEN